jgi:hypothetical protein
VVGGRSSSELGIAATPGHGGLPQRHGRQEGARGDPSGGITSGAQGGVAAVGVEALGERR